MNTKLWGEKNLYIPKTSRLIFRFLSQQICFWQHFLGEEASPRKHKISHDPVRDTQSPAGRLVQAPTLCSEEASLGQQGARLQQQTLAVDAEGVEDGEEVVRAEERVGQGEAQRGGDEAPAVLHHPGAGAPLHRGGLAHRVHDGVAWGERERGEEEEVEE